MIVSKDRIKALLRKNSTFLKEIYSDDQYIKTYYISNIEPDADFSFENSSLKYIPLDGWCEEVDQMLKKAFKYVYKAVYQSPNQKHYRPYLMFDKAVNNIDTAIIEFGKVDDEERKIIESDQRDDIPVRVWAQEIKTQSVGIKPINWVNEDQENKTSFDA